MTTRRFPHLAAALATACAFTLPAQAQDAGTVRATLAEAASIHAVATAARLCNLISDHELARAASRMDRVHAHQLEGRDQETYLIVRGSETFRNQVFAAALRRAQGDCRGDVATTWTDVHSSLVLADIGATSPLASAGGAAE